MDELLLTEIKNGDKNEEFSADLPVVEEMMKLGLLWGHKKSKTHPRMKPYIFTTRNGIEIIDLSQTLKALDKAMEFIKSVIAARGVILLVGTTPASKTAVEETAKSLGLPYVTERWLGGTLTNFKTLSKRIAYFKKMRADRASGKFDKYTKKEKLVIDEEIKKLTLKFSGVENMENIPQALFLLEIPHHLTAVREAKRLGIPLIALVNTNVNPELIDYPIFANDRSKAGIEWILNKFKSIVEQAKTIPLSSNESNS